MSLLLAFVTSLALAAPGAAFPTDTKLSTTDGKTVAATLGVPAKGGENGVVFVHMSGRSRDDWAPVAEKFYRQGMLVLTVDLRGHGANVTSEAPPALTGADYSAMAEDVRAGVDELRRRGAKKVALVGAELGANLALVVAASDPTIASVALLSPGLDVKGVLTGEAAKRYGPRPILYVAGSDDTYSVRSATALDSLATGPHTLTVLENAGKGTKMFNRVPTLESQLLGFVSTSWSVTATATSAPVDIKVNTNAMESTGKRIGEGETPPEP